MTRELDGTRAFITGGGSGIGQASAIALAIELDDKTHLAPDRRARDLFVDRALGAAGIAILRVQAAARYDVRGLTQAVAERVRAAA